VEPEPTASSGAGPSPTVLVADDSATVRAVVAAELTAAGYAVEQAADGQAAIDLVRSRPVDAVLLDVEMPVLDGWAVVAALKADPATAHVPVVFLTGRAATDDVVQALGLGAHDFVRKPPRAAELLARVAAAVRTKTMHDALRRRAERLEVQGRTDVLTGARNRRHAEEHLDAAVRLSPADGRPLAVLIVDVDRFKPVNDEHGHAVGDRVLQEVADRLAATVRADDLLARWGGDEFLVVSRSSGAEGGQVLGERLRLAVGSPPLRPVPGAPPVTVSVGGVETLVTPGSAQDELLAAADRNLYAAKSGGRDRTVVTTPTDAV
jgi:two-component system, cell cycle response regulator